jgi:hypothetical protein
LKGNAAAGDAVVALGVVLLLGEGNAVDDGDGRAATGVVVGWGFRYSLKKRGGNQVGREREVVVMEWDWWKRREEVNTGLWRRPDGTPC